MSKTLSRPRAIILAAILLCAGGLAALGVFTLGSRGWFGYSPLVVHAGFTEVRGVEVGTRVRIRGVDAGEVVAIERGDDDETPVILRLSIKQEFATDVRDGSTVRIADNGLLGNKAVEIRAPRLPPGKKLSDLPLVASGAMLPGEPQVELGDLVAQLSDAVKGLKGGTGTVGKLLSDPRAYDNLLALLDSMNDAARSGKETIATIQRSGDAIKKVPFLGGYVEDPTAILVRANSERNRRIFAEAELFEPGRAVLTGKGRQVLDDLGPWLTGLRHPGSDIVVVSFTDPTKGDGPTALAISRQQADTVAEYLKTKHRAHKMGGWGWLSGNRKVTPLGMGPGKPPQTESTSLPAARIEVIVFVPQK